MLAHLKRIFIVWLNNTRIRQIKRLCRNRANNINPCGWHSHLVSHYFKPITLELSDDKWNIKIIIANTNKVFDMFFCGLQKGLQHGLHQEGWHQRVLEWVSQWQHMGPIKSYLEFLQYHWMRGPKGLISSLIWCLLVIKHDIVIFNLSIYWHCSNKVNEFLL